jgi:putative DNA primase/helicase
MAAKRAHMTVVAGPNPEDAFRSRLTKTSSGDTKAIAFNFSVIFEGDSRLKDLFTHDLFSNKVMLSGVPPWDAGEPGEFTERAAFELSAWLGDPENYSMPCKPAQVAEAVEAVSFRHPVHCVRAYLDSLTHDGKARVDKMFSAYFGTKDDEYHEGVALIFLLGAVARIYEPGCKVDHMLILEGPQGAGKTRSVRTLFGGDAWYVDCQRSPADKDFYQDIVGKWAAEIGEMTSFTKADYNKVKQTITAQSDTYRPSYGRYSKTFPRQCIFIGTTNDDSWQRDPTGGRRYLPVRVSGVDVDAIERDRDQLWAEAVARYKAGEPWWNAPARAGDEQEQRYQEDSWTEPVLRWLAGKASSSTYTDIPIAARDKHGRILECSVTQVMTSALHIDLARQDRTASTRVGTIMSRIGWKKYRPSGSGKRPWLWYVEADWEWPDAI